MIYDISLPITQVTPIARQIDGRAPVQIYYGYDAFRILPRCRLLGQCDDLIDDGDIEDMEDFFAKV